MLFAFTILQWSQRTRWVPTDYKSVAELKSRYSDLRGQHKTLVAKLKKAGNTDPTQNPYAVRDDSQDGGYGYDQNARAADQLALQDLEADMREVYMQIEEAREASGGIQRNVRRVANEVFQGTINSVPKAMRGAVKQGFLAEYNRWQNNGYFERSDLASEEQSREALQQLLDLVVGKVLRENGGRPRPKPTGMSGEEGDPEPEDDDPYAGLPEESRRILQRYDQEGTGPRLLADVQSKGSR